jgi:lyso-ornithine lipid O-acyltransferase
VTAIGRPAPAIRTLPAGWARGAFRLAAILPWTAACWLGWVISGAGQAGATRREAMVRRWARGILGILHVEVETTGTPPARPFLLVANHLSYVDVVVLMTLVDAVFVAKREVRRWPLFGPLARIVGTIFIDRESMRDVIRVTDAMKRARADGHGVVLFAEGTSSDGTRILPLRPALLDAAARGEWPVHVASLSYHTAPTDPPANEALCWWGDMTFLPHLAALCRLTRARARVSFTPQAIMASDRRALATGLHAAMCRSFTPSGHES